MSSATAAASGDDVGAADEGGEEGDDDEEAERKKLAGSRRTKSLESKIGLLCHPAKRQQQANGPQQQQHPPHPTRQCSLPHPPLYANRHTVQQLAPFAAARGPPSSAGQQAGKAFSRAISSESVDTRRRASMFHQGEVGYL